MLTWDYRSLVIATMECPSLNARGLALRYWGMQGKQAEESETTEVH